MIPCPICHRPMPDGLKVCSAACMTTHIDQSLGIPAEPPPEPERHCEHCGEVLVRKMHANDKPESIQAFTARRFCGMTCRGHWQEEHGTLRRPIPTEEEIAERCAEIRAANAAAVLMSPNNRPKQDGGPRQYTTRHVQGQLVIKAD
jgi:hypothetical protein